MSKSPFLKAQLQYKAYHMKLFEQANIVCIDFILEIGTLVAAIYVLCFNKADSYQDSHQHALKIYIGCSFPSSEGFGWKGTRRNLVPDVI